MIAPKSINEEITMIEQKWGHLPFFRKTGDEWHSGCPVCGVSDHVPGNGEPDRFWVQTSVPGYNAHGYCRRCGHLAWLYDLKGGDKKPLPEELQKQAELRRKYQEQQAERTRKLIKRLNEEAYWRGYHEAMTQSHRQLWRDEGIADWAIDFHKLGVDERGGRMSIPFFDCTMEQLNSLHYKLLSGDGYRYPKGLGPHWFMPMPPEDRQSVCLVVEGEKKSLVLYDRVRQVKFRGADINVKATPMKRIPRNMLDDLEDYEVVLLLLDPDAYIKGKQEKESAINRNKRLIGADKCKVVPNIGDKVDDALLNRWITQKSLRCAIDRAV